MKKLALQMIAVLDPVFTRESLIDIESYKLLEKRMQMLFVLALFFPTLLMALGGKSEDVNSSVLSWGIGLAGLLIAYLCVGWFRNRISHFVGNVVHILILINIVSFIPAFVILGKYPVNIPFVVANILIISLGYITLLPSAISVVLTLDWILDIIYENHHHN